MPITFFRGSIVHTLKMYRRDGSIPHLRSAVARRSEEHTSELQSPCNLVCRLLLEKKNKIIATLLFLIQFLVNPTISLAYRPVVMCKNFSPSIHVRNPQASVR